MSDIKKIDAAEFRRLGLLQEVNRQFLHPLGLALEAVVNDDGEVTGFGGVWDYRDDPEGMVFAMETDAAMADYVDGLRRSHFDTRCDLFGVGEDIRRAVAAADVQPVGWVPPEEGEAA